MTTHECFKVHKIKGRHFIEIPSSETIDKLLDDEYVYIEISKCKIHSKSKEELKT